MAALLPLPQFWDVLPARQQQGAKALAGWLRRLYAEYDSFSDEHLAALRRWVWAPLCFRKVREAREHAN